MSAKLQRKSSVKAPPAENRAARSPAPKATAQSTGHLQRSVGNLGIQQLLQPSPAVAEPAVSTPDDHHGPAAGRVTHAPPQVDAVLRRAGRPLDAEARRFMEPRFGRPLGDVRVHADSAAADSARAVDAMAYTVGRHVVFGAGHYAPHHPAGRQLLAHELAHVVQQDGSARAPAGRLAVNDPRGSDEMAADRAAQSIAHGRRVDHPLGKRPMGLQRAVRERVVRDFQPNAQVCMVHLHGNEENALHAAQQMRRTRCANLVHLNSTGRNINVDVPPAGSGTVCQADPNRIFTATGLSNNAIVGTCPRSARAQVRTDITQFRDQDLAPAIRDCRGGGTTGLSGPLPVVAFHNNSPGGFSINSYSPGGSEAGATETDPTVLAGRTNPSILSGTGSDPHRLRDPDNFLLATDSADFDGLRGSANTVLQSHSPTDDGSLSVALAGQRYVNVEAEGKTFVNNTSRFFLTNMELARQVMDQLGVSEQPCSRTGSQRESGSGERDTGTRQVTPAEADSKQAAEPTGEETSQESILEWLFRLLREILRVLVQWSTMPPPMPRQPPPANLPTSCRTFSNQADLDARKSHFATVIAGMPAADVVNWIIGVGTPPAAVQAEATAQKDCLLFAIRAAAAAPGSGLSLPRGNATRSSRRGFTRQQGIWNRKFQFTGTPFDRISAHARRVCGSLLLSSETRWDPANARHRVCWNVAPRRGVTPPALPAGARALTDDERQAEILQASSAPGISRHHFGTDFDLFDPDMNPARWQAGQPFADEYSWLSRNASTYGFIQPMTATSTFMRIGYMEERWHWSYYPAAQALVDFGRSHQSDIQTALFARWGSQRQFSFIRGHWRDFFFNVNESGVF